MVDDWSATRDADEVYDSVDGLAAAWHASMAALTGMPEFHAWQRSNPTFKQLLLGSLWTAQGPWRVMAVLDTGATHCIICARLATALGLRPPGQPSPTSVSTAAGSVGGSGTRLACADSSQPWQSFLRTTFLNQVLTIN